MDLRAKPAHQDKTLGSAIAAAAALVGFAQGESDIVLGIAIAGASIILSIAVGGRFILRKESVSSTALMSYNSAQDQLPEFDELQEGYDDE